MKLLSSSILITFFLLCGCCFASSMISQPDFLSHYCFDNGNYTNNSAYQTNLNIIFTAINSNTQIDYGYYNFSSGQNSVDKAYAFALCRGDVTLADCRRCVNESTHKLTQVCPYNKEAIGWYDNCMLRYATDSSIFDTTTYTDPSFTIPITQNEANPNGFEIAMRGLMANLSRKASSGDSHRKFATGDVGGLGPNKSQKIYGLVQCTPALSKLLCSICIDETVNMIADGTTGLRFFRASCNLRFDSYKFYRSDDVAIALPPPKSNPRGSSSSKGKITTLQFMIIIVVSVMAYVMLTLIIGIYLRSRTPPNKNEEMKNIK